MSMLDMAIFAKAWLALRLRQVIPNDRGATAVEYGIMVALIAAVIVLVVTALGNEIKDVFQDVLEAIQGRSST